MRTDKAVLYVLSWIPGYAVLLVLYLLGLIAVPIALRVMDTTGRWPRLLWLWGNDMPNDTPGEQPNVVPAWWLRLCADGEEGKFASWFPRFYWFALRNGVNNRRFLLEDRDDVKVDTNWTVDEPMEAPNMLNHGFGEVYRWTWSGPYASYRIVKLEGNNKYTEYWFGWKVGSDVPGLALTAQIRRKRKIGT